MRKPERYISEAKKNKVRLAGTCLDILHVNYLKKDKLALKWITSGIPITKKLDAKVMLLPFFGDGALSTRRKWTMVGDALKELAPEAEKAGIKLGLENTISAEDNVRIMDGPAPKRCWCITTSEIPRGRASMLFGRCAGSAAAAYARYT